MRTTMWRVAGKLADAVHEMNEAQRLMLTLRTATDRYSENPGATPDTYEEFLARTSGVLLHEPPARKRIRKARLSGCCVLAPGVLLALLPVGAAAVRPGLQPCVVEPASEQLAAVDDPADADQPRLHDQEAAQRAVADRVPTISGSKTRPEKTRRPPRPTSVATAPGIAAR